MVDLTPKQQEILAMLEEEGIDSKERVHILAEMVKNAEAFGRMRRWIISAAAALTATGILAGAVAVIRGGNNVGP